MFESFRFVTTQRQRVCLTNPCINFHLLTKVTREYHTKVLGTSSPAAVYCCLRAVYTVWVFRETCNSLVLLVPTFIPSFSYATAN